MIKEELTDEDLLTLIEAGSKSAEDALYNRYYQLSEEAGINYYKLYKKYGITAEEFASVAFSKVYDALCNYKNVRVDFRSYWRVLVKNAVLDYIKESGYELSVKYGGNLSLDARAYLCSEELLLSDVIGSNEMEYLEGDTLLTLFNSIISKKEYNFTNEERRVAKLVYIMGYKKREVAEMLKVSDDHISYVLKSAKKKIIKILKEVYN